MIGIHKIKVKIKEQPEKVFELKKEPMSMITNGVLRLGYWNNGGLKNVFFECQEKDLEYMEVSIKRKSPLSGHSNDGDEK